MIHACIVIIPHGWLDRERLSGDLLMFVIPWLLSIFNSWEGQPGEGYSPKGPAKIQQHVKIGFEDVYRGGNPAHIFG